MTREKAIDIIKCLAWHTRPDEEDVEQAIKVLEQEPRWVPVTEKPSDPGEDVLVTVNLGSIRAVGVDEYSLVEEDGFEGYGKDVIAWMSLPKPYKPQESEG